MNFNVLTSKAGLAALAFSLALIACAGQEQSDQMVAANSPTPQSASAGSTGGSERIAFSDPAALSQSAYFELYDRMKLVPIIRDPRNARTRQELVLSHAAESARRMDADTLADETMRSWEGMLSSTLQKLAGDMMAKAGVSVSSGQMLTHVPDGSTITMARPLASSLHGLAFRAVTATRTEKGPWKEMSGEYEIATTGSCPLAAGPISVVQRDFLIQGDRDNRPLFWGALGTGKLYVVVNEQRYASRRIDPKTNRGTLEVPDKASELFAGDANAKSLALAGTVHRECTFTLTRKG